MNRLPGAFILVALAFLIACASGVVPTAEPTPMPTGKPPPSLPMETPSAHFPTPEQTTLTPTRIAKSLEVDLSSVPMVDLSKNKVPLEEVVFDTFDSRFVRLNMATQQLIEDLRDVIKPIYNPIYGESSGLPWLRDSDLVLGYVSKGTAYSYPLKILNSQELVNDVIDGVPVLVSYCPLCASGVVYIREVEGRTMVFGNTSALFQSDLVMFDHQTGSYWFQVLGEAIVGEMTGKRLTPLPSITTSWGEWKRLHPDTRLLVSDGGIAFGSRYASDPFSGGYSAGLDAGRFPFPVSEERMDNRLRASEIVITVELNSSVKAYAPRLIGNAAVNDQVGGQPVVVFSSEPTASAFLATVSGMRLTFQYRNGTFVDIETGSTWNVVGRAVAGTLEGSSLEPVPSRRGFWFSIAGAIRGLELHNQ